MAVEDSKEVMLALAAPYEIAISSCRHDQMLSVCYLIIGVKCGMPKMSTGRRKFCSCLAWF